MAQFSKDELSFAEEIPKHVEIECPVCLNIMTDPHLVSCCGHNFCESCIERVKAGDGACPMCKEKNYQSFADKKCLRIINGLQVYCLNRKKGCQWKGELKYLSTHTNRDKREGECLYQEVKCRYEECERKGQRHHIGYHEQQRCPQRPFKCTHCNTKGTHCFITEEHMKTCLKVPTACPNKCTDDLIPRDSVPAHLTTECPLQPVDCVFSWAGCKERPLRKNIELHTADTKHMMILAVACGELKKENEAFKKTCDQLEMENETLKKEHSYTRDLLGVVATDTHPTLPITITVTFESVLSLFVTVTRERKVVHFYTEVGGYHMSAGFMSHTIYLALHEGKFDRIMKLTDYPKINIKEINLEAKKYIDDVEDLEEYDLEDLECIDGEVKYIGTILSSPPSFQETMTLKIPDDALVSFLTSEKLTTPAGIISYQVYRPFLTKYSVEISFTACNELTVLLSY